MKIIKSIAAAGLGLVVMSSAAYAQSLSDAKKAIDAEQYQKAKSMLKNLTVTEPTKDENYFYLGWVYIKQDDPDSAQMYFQKGLTVNPNSALNDVGLGVVARINKDQAGAKSYFSKAMSLAGKDSKPYVYIGKGYLLPGPNDKVDPKDAQAALNVLNTGKVATAVKKSKRDKNVEESNDPELYMTMGDADRLLLKSDSAYTNFNTALTLDPKSAAANVALGTLWKYADNFEDAEKQFKAALAIDPNYGPAYREWAETDLRWAQSNPSMASAKVKEAAEHYKQYITLTDYSPESQMRYADFLINAGDYKTLQQVASDLSKSANSNLRAYRYLGYSAYENKDYPAALTAMNTWMTKADPKRIIPRDYLYYGRAQIANGQDSLGIQTLQKALKLDSNETDVYKEMAQTLFTKDKKYLEAANAFQEYINKGRKVTLNDHFYMGLSYYFAYLTQYSSKDKNISSKADTGLLTKADSAFSYVQQKMGANTPPDVYVYRARANDYKETDRNNIKGLAKPYYEKFIEAVVAKGGTPDDRTKRNMVEAYDYLGTYYEYKEKDDAKAAENFGKARDLDPTNQQALDYFKKKGGTKSK
ncbi:MAG TPA: hypothetical protein VHB54_14540 [Mucilaginibacter sp.]|nr:hypothetical protein [Mucilaginibacter sp.]